MGGLKQYDSRRSNEILPRTWATDNSAVAVSSFSLVAPLHEPSTALAFAALLWMRNLQPGARSRDRGSNATGSSLAQEGQS